MGKVSFTTDVWTDQSLNAYMGVTAHWIEGHVNESSYGPKYNLEMRAELIGFYHIPGSHTGEHLAHAFLKVIDRFGLARKVRNLFTPLRSTQISNRLAGFPLIMHQTTTR